MDSIRFEELEDGVVVPVRAKPAARRNAIEGTHDGALRIAVTAAPEKGKANKAICELLAKVLGVRKGDVRLLSGATSARKRFLVTGTTPGEVREALEGRLKDR